MSEYICNAGRGVTCAHKRNIKPYTACAWGDIATPQGNLTCGCPYGVLATAVTHGSITMAALEGVK